jgi:hypothetical protein
MTRPLTSLGEMEPAFTWLTNSQSSLSAVPLSNSQILALSHTHVAHKTICLALVAVPHCFLGPRARWDMQPFPIASRVGRVGDVNLASITVKAALTILPLFSFNHTALCNELC